jgi:3-deoxy-D-manno-octulosonic-acid transferase
MATAARLFYNGLVVPAARVALPVAARLHPPLGRAVSARRGVIDRWREAAARAVGRSPRIWLHASSAGETIQARPLVEAIRAARPGAAIFFSHWSESAARYAQGWESVDAADFLPLDTPGRMRSLARALAPDLVVLVGAETWPNFVWAAAAERARVAQACCRLPADSGRLRWPARALTREVYAELDAVAAIGEDDAARVRALGVPPGAVEVTGDTRVDATLDRAERAAAEPLPWSSPVARGPLVVAGSTHSGDERALVPALAELRRRFPGLVAIVAPHDPDAAAVARLEARAGAHGLVTRRLSDPARNDSAVVIVVDGVGLLHRLYALADAAFVGGAFDGSVHNTMEPAVYGVPILVGPRPGRFQEVADLEAAGALVSVGSPEALAGALGRWLDDPAARSAAGRAARETLERHRGATERTLRFFRERGLPV